MSSDAPATPEGASPGDDAAPRGAARQREHPVSDEAAPSGATTPPSEAVERRRFTALLLAAAGLTSVLSLVLFAVFAWLGMAAAPYGAVGVAVVGGVVMRRVLLDRPGTAQVVLFSAVCIGGALGGLWMANLLFS